MNSSLDESRPLTPKLIEALRDRMRLATDMSESVTWLRGLGFSDEAILAGIEAVRPRGNSLEQGISNPPLLRRSPPNLRKLATDRVQIYALDDFLSPAECTRLVALCSHHLRPSTLAYASTDSAFRTSTTADLCHLKSPVATGIDDKICRTLGIRPSYSEGIQAQRYDVGQQFKTHNDFFEPNTNVYQKFAGVRGNRTWTFMVYLNDGMEGGATRFPLIDQVVHPRLGMALLWNNLKEDGSPNRDTEHCGEPVTRGHKVIITKWFRVFGDGPLFFE
jgi:prolyl 4-hydroxylase